MLIDTHCHIHFNAYKEDMDEVIKRSLSENVFMITVGTQQDTSRRGVEVAEKYDGVWATIGLHPSHTSKQSFEDDDEIPTATIKTRSEEFDPAFYRELAKSKKVIAIGECGLDFYHLPEDISIDEVKEKQKTALRAQFDLADELNLPLVIHSRNAHEEQVALLREYVEAGKLSRRGVVHCFSGTLDQANDYFNLGFLISFTGIVTFPPKKSEGELSNVQRVAKAVPLEKVLIETDAPYLAPPPYRGKRNEPRYVIEVARKLAELHGKSLEEVIEMTTRNAENFFKIKITE
ncbi:MAG: TatD family hydrolase [Patescibacteria group bacterium]|jgi:TatD DNase family protein